MTDYSLEQAKIDIARLQSQINAYERIVKAFPGLLDVRGSIKIAGDFSGDGNYGWISAGETWTYASSTTVKISGDKTAKYSKGMKVKYTQSGTVKQGYIIANPTYLAPDTTLTIYSGTDYTIANAPIASPYYSMVANPAGFPHKFSYTPTVTSEVGPLTSYTSSGKFYINGGVGKVFTFISITDAGTGSGGLIISLPFINQSGLSIIGVGREDAINGNMLEARVYSGSSEAFILRYNNTTIIATGVLLITTIDLPLY